MNFGIYYGVLHPTIEKQLQDQKIYIDGVQAMQKNRDAINRLYFAEILTESEKDKAFKRLHKIITRAVKEATT